MEVVALQYRVSGIILGAQVQEAPQALPLGMSLSSTSILRVACWVLCLAPFRLSLHTTLLGTASPTHVFQPSNNRTASRFTLKLTISLRLDSFHLFVERRHQRTFC